MVVRHFNGCDGCGGCGGGGSSCNGGVDCCEVNMHSLRCCHLVPLSNARYAFISGARDVGSFHHDVSHVVAWQIEGTKRFCGLRCPSTLHPESERRKHGQTVSPPAELTEADVLAVSDALANNTVSTASVVCLCGWVGGSVMTLFPELTRSLAHC